MAGKSIMIEITYVYSCIQTMYSTLNNAFIVQFKTLFLITTLFRIQGLLHNYYFAIFLIYLIFHRNKSISFIKTISCDTGGKA